MESHQMEYSAPHARALTLSLWWAMPAASLPSRSPLLPSQTSPFSPTSTSLTHTVTPSHNMDGSIWRFSSHSSYEISGKNERLFLPPSPCQPALHKHAHFHPQYRCQLLEKSFQKTHWQTSFATHPKLISAHAVSWLNFKRLQLGGISPVNFYKSRTVLEVRKMSWDESLLSHGLNDLVELHDKTSIRCSMNETAKIGWHM